MKSVNKKLITSVLLSAKLALLLSCGAGSPENSVETSDNTETVTDAAVTEAAPVLPERNFGGRTFKFLTDSWGSYSPLNYIDIEVGEQNGEVINDAAFRRNTEMEDKYGCKIEITNQATDADGFTKLSQVVLAGDTEYDIVQLRGRRFAPAITYGYLTDL